MVVYTVINEFIPNGFGDPMTEIVQPSYLNYQDALEALHDIASDAGVPVRHGDTSVYLPVNGSHLESDEYYVIEQEVV